jgi:hypothetical protein
MDEDDESHQKGSRWEYTSMGLEDGWAGCKGKLGILLGRLVTLTGSYQNECTKVYLIDGGWPLGGLLLRSMLTRKQKGKERGKRRPRS